MKTFFLCSSLLLVLASLACSVAAKEGFLASMKEQPERYLNGDIRKETRAETVDRRVFNKFIYDHDRNYGNEMGMGFV